MFDKWVVSIFTNGKGQWEFTCRNTKLAAMYATGKSYGTAAEAAKDAAIVIERVTAG